MNAQHRLNRRANRARRLTRQIEERTAAARDYAAQPVTVARIESELVGLRRTLSQYTSV